MNSEGRVNTQRVNTQRVNTQRVDTQRVDTQRVDTQRVEGGADSASSNLLALSSNTKVKSSNQVATSSNLRTTSTNLIAKSSNIRANSSNHQILELMRSHPDFLRLPERDIDKLLPAIASISALAGGITLTVVSGGSAGAPIAIVLGYAAGAGAGISSGMAGLAYIYDPPGGRFNSDEFTATFLKAAATGAVAGVVTAGGTMLVGPGSHALTQLAKDVGVGAHSSAAAHVVGAGLDGRNPLEGLGVALIVGGAAAGLSGIGDRLGKGGITGTSYIQRVGVGTLFGAAGGAMGEVGGRLLSGQEVDWKAVLTSATKGAIMGSLMSFIKARGERMQEVKELQSRVGSGIEELKIKADRDGVGIILRDKSGRVIEEIRPNTFARETIEMEIEYGRDGRIGHARPIINGRPVDLDVPPGDSKCIDRSYLAAKNGDVRAGVNERLVWTEHQETMNLLSEKCYNLLGDDYARAYKEELFGLNVVKPDGFYKEGGVKYPAIKGTVSITPQDLVELENYFNNDYNGPANKRTEAFEAYKDMAAHRMILQQSALEERYVCVDTNAQKANTQSPKVATALLKEMYDGKPPTGLNSAQKKAEIFSMSTSTQPKWFKSYVIDEFVTRAMGVTPKPEHCVAIPSGLNTWFNKFSDNAIVNHCKQHHDGKYVSVTLTINKSVTDLCKK